MRMDTFDRQILKFLQADSRITTEELGARIGLSATACQRRIKKLREDGIILKEVALLDGIAVGGYVTVIVEVLLHQGSFQNIDTFKQQMLKFPQVQQCYYVTGHNDFVLIVIAENMLEYEKLTRELFFNNANIKKFHSTVVMENVKVGLDVPVD
jgi:Lrp/AsnC family leucine-responsive transcriptional regulator